MKDSNIYDTEIDNTDKNTIYSKEIELIGFNKKVLEFGCSTGYVSSILKQRGCRVTGIEIDENAAKKAREYCEKVIVGDVDTIDLDKELKEKKFDVILFGDILEHLKDTKKILIKSKDFLTKDGYSVLSIPNVAHWSTRLELLGGNFDYQKLGILDDSHLRFFTKKSITNLLEASGYFIEIIDYVKQEFDAAKVEATLKMLGGDVNLKKMSLILNEPDAEAYQYVIKASAFSEYKYIEKLSNDKIMLENEIKERKISLAEKDKQIDNLHVEIQNKDKYIHDLETVNIQNNQKINGIYGSISWKITFPFRYLHEKLIKLMNL